MLSLLYGPTHISVHDCKENRIFDYTDLCPQSNISAFKYAIYVSHSFISKEHLLISRLQSPSTVILRPRKGKICHCFPFSPSICHEVMGLVTVVLVLSLRFKRAFLLFSFTLIKRPFSSSSFMQLVQLSTYWRSLILVLTVLITACASSSPAFCMMYSAYKWNKQGDNI